VFNNLCTIGELICIFLLQSWKVNNELLGEQKVRERVGNGITIFVKNSMQILQILQEHYKNTPLQKKKSVQKGNSERC
jgi:hypothetical protein